MYLNDVFEIYFHKYFDTTKQFFIFEILIFF